MGLYYSGKEEKEEKLGSYFREELPDVVDYGGNVVVIHDDVD